MSPLPFAGLFGRIRSLGVRRVLGGLGLFAVSLVVGRICETVFAPETLRAALVAQDRWINTLRGMSPFALSREYLADLGPASRGALIYRGPSPADIDSARALIAAQRDSVQARLACRAALSFADGTRTIPPACAAIGVTDPVAFILKDRGMDGVTAQLPTEKAGGASSARTVPTVLLPFAGLVRTVTRLASGGVMATILLVLQLGMGVLGVLVLADAFSGNNPSSNSGGLLPVLLLPVASVVMGSVLAWVLQRLMLGGLGLFHWATQLAAMAAGAGGVMGFCWYCTTKLGEKGLETAVVGRK